MVACRDKEVNGGIIKVNSDLDKAGCICSKAGLGGIELR